MASPAPPPANQPSDAPAEDVEVVGAPSPLEIALQENRGKFFGGIAVIFLAISAFFVVHYQKEAKQLAAAEAFTAATTVEELEAVTNDHPGTLGGGNALIAAANLLATGPDKKPDEAIAKLETFLADFPEHPLRPQAMFAIGMQKQAAGNGAEAKAAYERILSEAPDSAVAPGAIMRLGDLAWDEGDKEAARQQYEQIASARYAGNEFILRADERLRQLDEPSPSEPSERQQELKAKEEAEKLAREETIKKSQEEAEQRAEEAAAKAKAEAAPVEETGAGTDSDADANTGESGGEATGETTDADAGAGSEADEDVPQAPADNE